MEKLSEITFGKRGWAIKFGSVLIILIMGLILYVGFYKIELPQYIEIEIISSNNELFFISKLELDSLQKIELEDKKILITEIKKIGVNKYRISSNSVSKPMLQNLQTNLVTNGRILISRENLFESLLPFL